MTQREIDMMYSGLVLLGQDHKGNRLYSNKKEKHWCRSLSDVIYYFGNIGDYQI